jgi:hypothetical protein
MMLSMITQMKASAVGLAALAAVAMPAPLAHAHYFSPLHMTMAQQGWQGASGTSRNWSGYVAQQGQYTSVSGTWKVPAVTGDNPSSADGTWIGIGGVSSDDLIQSGTQDTVDDFGQVTTSAFYELLPDAPITIPTVTPRPGDTVTVSIAQQQPNQWLINFTDKTNGQKYSTTVSYASSLSSAEWIEEAPSDGWGTMPLASFSSISFTHASTNQGTLTQSGAQPLTMVDDQEQTLATPSALGKDGASFTVSDQQQSSGGSSSGTPWWSSPGDSSGSGGWSTPGDSTGPGWWPTPGDSSGSGSWSIPGDSSGSGWWSTQGSSLGSW